MFFDHIVDCGNIATICSECRVFPGIHHNTHMLGMHEGAGTSFCCCMPDLTSAADSTHIVSPSVPDAISTANTTSQRNIYPVRASDTINRTLIISILAINQPIIFFNFIPQFCRFQPTDIFEM